MHHTIEFPCFTASVCRLLAPANDKQLTELVRIGRIHPAPEVVSGRRLWQPEHVRQAAEALGRLTAEIEGVLAAAEEAGR